ncbi:MAG: MATE family efflux transporter [Christensenellales bacterium]|jgi:putative MATE family efflux protein
MFMDKLKKFFGAQDMTRGKPFTRIFMFAMPLLVGNIAQQLYNTVDSIVVGKFVGDEALAAVGATMPVFNLIIVMFSAVATGAGIMVAQYFGAREKGNLSRTVGNAMVLTLFVSVLMTALGLLIVRPLLRLLRTPENILEMSATYMTILISTMVFCAYYNIFAGILRGVGDAVMPLVFLLIACVLNIFLDILFVAAFHWGVAGVAWATVISQCVSGILCVFRLTRMRDRIHFTRNIFKLRGSIVKRMLKLGVPSGITMAIFSLASIAVQSLVNSFGTAVMSCAVMIMRVDGFAMMPNFTFGMAMSTFTGQNIGAGRMDRVNKGVSQGLLLSLSFSVALTVCILLFGSSLLGLFTNTPEIIDMGMRMMRILAVGYVAMAVTQVLNGTMQGAGDTLTPMMISIITTVALRVPIAYTLAWLTRTEAMPQGDPSCLYWSLLISWTIGAVFSSVMFRVGKWRKRAIVSAVPVPADSLDGGD